MNLAICGYPQLLYQIQQQLKGSEFDIKFFIKDFVSGNFNVNLPLISFFEFRRLVDAGELDGLIIAAEFEDNFTKNIVQFCKFYSIPRVYVIVNWPGFNNAYLLDPSKAYICYLETNMVDSCNLNCKNCAHFSSLFRKDEVYPLEDFERDICQLSKQCDVMIFRLLGGEPLLLKNLDEYLKIARNYFPKTNLRIVTNGLLIQSLTKRVLKAIKENNFIVDITPYAPTRKIIHVINEILTSYRIPFWFDEFFKDEFVSFLTLHPGNNTAKSRVACGNDVCRFLRNGKIYKCPVDALKYRYEEKFGIEGLPAATGIDIYAPNFPSLIRMLDGDVEMCGWCAEQHREISWQPTNNPKIEDWLADPDELKNFM